MRSLKNGETLQQRATDQVPNVVKLHSGSVIRQASETFVHATQTAGLALRRQRLARLGKAERRFSGVFMSSLTLQPKR
jgi:hypothetical protein